GLAPDAQYAHHLAAGDGAECDQVGAQALWRGAVGGVCLGGCEAHAAAPVPGDAAVSLVMRTNSSSRRLDLLRIERTRMPASSSVANTRLRSIERGMSMSSVCASIAATRSPSIAGSSAG